MSSLASASGRSVILVLDKIIIILHKLCDVAAASSSYMIIIIIKLVSFLLAFSNITKT